MASMTLLHARSQQSVDNLSCGSSHVQNADLLNKISPNSKLRPLNGSALRSFSVFRSFSLPHVMLPTDRHII